jgi:hypothetical protein
MLFESLFNIPLHLGHDHLLQGLIKLNLNPHAAFFASFRVGPRVVDAVGDVGEKTFGSNPVVVLFVEERTNAVPYQTSFQAFRQESRVELD